MADFKSLSEDVSPDEPCGPDLDLQGDPDFLNVVARAEGILPTSFFTRDEGGNLAPFDRSTIDFPTEFKALDRLLDTTRDFRLLTLYVRFLALNRDLAGVSECMRAIATLATDKWDEVHPKGEGGDFGFRGAVLQALDDMPTVILPLQHVPLALSRRNGIVTYRTVMVAKGEAKPRADEPVLDEGGLERAFMEDDLEKLQATRERWNAIGDAAAALQLASIEKAGADGAVVLDRLPDLARKVLAVLDPILLQRDPAAAAELGVTPSEPGEDTAAASPGAAAPAAPVAGAVESVATAARALAALGAYFSRAEPSSPAALVVRQAQDLLGKSFLDVLRALVPSDAEDAKIPVGPNGVLQLTYAQLSTAHDAIEAQRDSAGEEGSDPDGADADGETGEAPIFHVGSRQQASQLLDEIGRYFRRAEPSSPIPLLIERARSLLDRDFMSILKDVLPGLLKRDS